jgi:hypothetical protein
LHSGEFRVEVRATTALAHPTLVCAATQSGVTNAALLRPKGSRRGDEFSHFHHGGESGKERARRQTNGHEARCFEIT